MTIIEIIQNPAIQAGIVLFARNIYGWANNSMKDGAIQDYEWKSLGKTILTLGGFSLFAYLGINAIFPGVLTVEESAALVSFVDVIKSYLKKPVETVEVKY
jgi:hypothetical protein